MVSHNWSCPDPTDTVQQQEMLDDMGDATLAMRGRGCLNMGDYELDSVSNLQIKMHGIPAPIEAPVNLAESLQYMNKYKNYVTNELAGEGVPIKIVYADAGALIPDQTTTLFYLPQSYQMEAAIDQLEDYENALIYWKNNQDYRLV